MSIRWLLLLILFGLVGCSAATGPSPTATPQVRGRELPGQLLFVADGQLWRWQGAGAAPLLATAGLSQPQLSPDGTQLALIERANSFSDLILLRADATPLGRLTDYGSSAPPNSFDRAYQSRWALYPTWSADGQSLFFCGQASPPVGDPAAEYNLALYRVAVQGGPASVVFSDDSGQCGRSAAHPDGQRLIVSRSPRQGGEGVRLFQIDLQSGQGAPLNGAPLPSYDPSFSRDGQWLLFTGRDDAGTDVFALPSGGNAARRLTSLGTARAAALSPDQRWLAFLALDRAQGGGFRLYVAEILDPANLTLGPAELLSPDLLIDADAGLTWR